MTSILPTTSSDDPKLVQLVELANELWRQRPDLQDAFPAHGSDITRKFWFWLSWYGTEPEFCARADEVNALMPSYPPDHLTGRVFGEESNQREFLTSGLVNWRRFLNCLEAEGAGLQKGMSVLDFGAGCGRVLRHFRYEAAHLNLDFTACDVDAEAMAWVQKELHVGRALTVPHLPPSELPDEAFDFVYSYSVFTHLTEEGSRRWLAEIHRAMKPGAVAILTTQGQCVGDIIRGDSRAHPFPPRDALEAQWNRYEEDGFLFFPYGEVHSNLEQNAEFFESWDLDAYGSTFVSPSYIHRVWAEWFDVVAIHEGPDKWQDFVVLRKS